MNGDVPAKAPSSLSKYLHRLGHTLRLRGRLAADPTARMLHALLLAVTLWMAFATIATLPISPVTPIRITTVLILEAALVAALVLLRVGQFRRAALVYLAGTWLWATLVVAFNGGIRSPALVLYVALPISAAWLLGNGATLWTTGVCLSSALVFAFLELDGATLRRYIPATPLGIWAVLVQAVLIGVVPVAQVLRTLRDTLAQSHRAQEELHEYKQHLELLVEQRAAEAVVARDQATAARDQAEAASQAKSVFLANMSHELRTPLNAILGFSDLLRTRGVSEEQRKDLDIINRSGEHLLSLINDVLDVAKIEAGHSVLDLAPCDLGNILLDVTEMMRLRAEEKHLALLVEAPAFTKHVRADAAKLRRVLINLIGNAVKYTEQGSVIVRLSTRPLDDSGKVLLVLQIEDTGIGIAAQDQARIFDAFVQVGKAGRQKGTGLGLAITRQCIELMGGTIQVESAPGLGSRFRVDVPVEWAQESEIIGPPAELERVVDLEPGQPEYRVLIVEDERENWMVLERLLREIGFQVRVAEDGAQGVERFREWRPQFIWMDLRMPVMDGFEATRHIRALEGGREAKIAGVTASVLASERSEVLAAGLDDYVRKPYRPNEIFDCMARHLGVRYRCTTAPPSFGEPAKELRPEGLAALPEELRAGLREALLALDVPRIAAIIESVAERDAELGAVLSHRAGRYAYTGIFNAIDLAMNHQPELVYDWEQRHHPHSRRRV